ncbi:DUF4124 domain-containing protein [Herbaspirillum sp. HC18]|nr:DUF4124 domain-containing protein [Herbaspirillum sp. HC18]
MNIQGFNSAILSICAALAITPSVCRAEIYKWVDESGRTHYSEKSDDAGKAKVVRLKETSSAPTRPESSTSQNDWGEQERLFRQRQARKSLEESRRPQVATSPKSLSGGRSDGTDASRCNLARDVLSGAVVHRNGAPTDKYDREIAENDVRMFCR